MTGRGTRCYSLRLRGCELPAWFQERQAHVNQRILSILVTTTGLALILAMSSTPSTLAQGRAGDAPAATVFQAAGPTPASIQASIDEFRAALGANNGNGAGPLAVGRREINWDGGGSLATSPAPTPFTGFLNNRGALFETDGSGFVQAPLDGLASTFGNLTYADAFQPFSLARLFTPVASNVTDVTFFVPGSNGAAAASTRAFGAIFSDVDEPNGGGPARKRGNRGASVLLEFYGAGGEVLFSGFAPASPGNASLTFFGVVFEDARITHVRITSGDVKPGVDDEEGRDVVMMDDFVYGEPQPLQ